MERFIVDGRYRELLTYHGIDPGAVLKAAMLPGDILSRGSITMTEEQYYRFLAAIESVGQVEGLAVTLATAERIEQFSPPIFAAFCSRNGRICIARLAKYKKLIGPMRLEIDESGGMLGVSFLPGDPRLRMPGFLAQSEIAFLLGILRHATGADITPLRITLTAPPPDGALARFAGIAPELGERNRIVFRAADMERPFISRDESMWACFEPELNRRLADLSAGDSVSARVRAALIELLPAGECGIEEVAAALGTSKRSLQRRLAEEGTSFREQLSGTRESLALHYVRSTDITAGDIAFLLGYAELNSFLRAFSVWTGKSFSECRRG